MERIVETWDELDVMLSLLARSATGQQLSVYTNIITGPRRPGELDGPDQLHVVVLDNGRSAVRTSEFADALDCIRCGACLNVCPVYRQIGGHAYGAVYSGPIGAVLTPLLRPDDGDARELSEASSLCGACWDVCPVRIPLHDLLLGLRRRDAPAAAGRGKRIGFAVWSWLWSTRAGFEVTRVGTRVGLPLVRRLPLRGGPGWAGAWLRTRDLPR
jgi:L-lactate dehydrogenase complex protein LldF